MAENILKTTFTLVDKVYQKTGKIAICYVLLIFRVAASRVYFVV